MLASVDETLQRARQLRDKSAHINGLADEIGRLVADVLRRHAKSPLLNTTSAPEPSRSNW